MDVKLLADQGELIKEERVSALLENYTGREIPNLGLEHLRPIFESFKDEFEKRDIKIVTVAGTNGKGETAYSLAHLLKEKGIKASVWSSPHILSLRERFIIDHEFAALAAIEEGIKKVIELKLNLSYYELLFYVFCDLAVKSKSQILILEVGLGGRLDAVNLFDADVVLLTSISRDHMAILGHRYEQILREKLGVVRASSVLYSALENRYLQDKMHAYLEDKKEVFDLFELGALSCDVSYRHRNRALAFCAYSYLADAPASINSRLLSKLLKKTWPAMKGRFEKMTDGVHTFIFIGAHNPDGFRAMTNALRGGDYHSLRALVAFSARDMREIRAALKTLLGAKDLIDHLDLVSFDHPRSWRPSDGEVNQLLGELVKINSQTGVTYRNEWNSNQWQKELGPNAEVLVCGSYYFVGAVQRALLADSYHFC